MSNRLKRCWPLFVLVLAACGGEPDTTTPFGVAGGTTVNTSGASTGGSSGAAVTAAGETSGGSAAGNFAMGATASGGVATGGISVGGSGGNGGEGAQLTGVAATRATILAYLRSISGKKTLSGQHNKEPNSDPTRWTKYVEAQTGKTPGLWSGDFLFNKDDFDNRSAMVAEAQRQFEAGALINLMWHACSPAGGETCQWNGSVVSDLSEQQWSDLVTDGGKLNGVWKSRMDQVGEHLQKLQQAGVVVMFRPFHEMNQGIFWWAGHSGEQGTKRLYQLTHDYFVKTKGLQNLIWIWDMQDLSGYQQAIPAYNPGPDYFDIAALDVYEGFNAQKYEVMQQVAGDKLIAIGECKVLPTPEYLETAPAFVFFMAWAEMVKDYNSTTALQQLYGADRVLTRDELPGWPKQP